MEQHDRFLTVQPRCWEKVYTWEEQPILTCQLSLPHVEGAGRGAKRIDRYYRHVERVLRGWLEAYHAQCCCLAQEALSASRPLPSCSVLADYQVAWQDEALLSVLWQLRWEGQLRRFPDLWEIASGTPVRCKSLLPRKTARQLRRGDCLLTESGILLLEPGEDRLVWARPKEN